MLRQIVRILGVIVIVVALYQFFGGDVVGALLAFITFIGDAVGQIAQFLSELPILKELFGSGGK